MSGTPRGRWSRVPGCMTAAAAALTLAVSGCGGGSGASDAEPALDPEARYSDTLSAADPPLPEDFTSADVAGVSVNVPAGWSVDTSNGRMCVRPPDRDTCGYGAIQVLPKVAERDSKSWPKKESRFNDPDGWAATPDTCRSLNTWESGSTGVDSAELEPLEGDGTVEHADGLRSHHRVWHVTCQNGDTFDVKLWFLPESDVAVYAWSVDAQYAGVYDKVAESMDVTEYKKNLAEEEDEDGGDDEGDGGDGDGGDGDGGD